MHVRCELLGCRKAQIQRRTLIAKKIAEERNGVFAACLDRLQGPLALYGALVGRARLSAAGLGPTKQVCWLSQLEFCSCNLRHLTPHKHPGTGWDLGWVRSHSSLRVPMITG